MPKIKFIIMSCGYVESNHTSLLVYGTHFHGHEGFDTAVEAVKELSLDLYAKFHDEYLSTYNNRYGADLKECCSKSLVNDKDAKFCATCGSRLEDKKFDGDAFMDFIRDLHGSTCDSYGESEWANGRDFVWWPWCNIGNLIGAPKETVVIIPESAEECLLEALAEAKPELFPTPSTEVDPYHIESRWEALKAGKSLLF